LSDGICGIRTFKNPIIPAQEGIRIHPHRNLHPVIPTKVGIQDAKSQETVLPDKFPHRQV
ncbi:TPA: hypothetical protein ACFOH0_001608, partial [Neisseria meningitidis]